MIGRNWQIFPHTVLALLPYFLYQHIQCSDFHTVGIAQLTGVTENRRADVSPYLNKDDIDPNLGVIGVNDMNGNPLATGYMEYAIVLCSFFTFSVELCYPWYMLGS